MSFLTFFSTAQAAMARTSRTRWLMGVSGVLRVLLIGYGEWQDAHMDVHYTDIDYLVFSDAASLMASNRSPYERATYRYSPLLALILTPNAFLHHCWGKFLFSVSGHVVKAAVWYGLVVHLRIYPIIYVIPILVVLDAECFKSSESPYLSSWNTEQCRSSGAKALCSLVTKGRFRVSLGLVLKRILNRERILFGLVSGAVFLLLTCIFYCLYGQQFLDEALLYHLTRTDPRHNFSIYFYQIYLHHEHEFTLSERLMTFVPQFLVQLVLILFFAEDLHFCLFAQTVAFVAFNKVITAQYFVWFFCLLPLILPWSRLNLRWKGFLCIGLWVGAQVHWLGWAYRLEFKGENVFVQLWLASIAFLAATTCSLGILLVNHRFCPLFQHKVLASDARDDKKTD